jgi:hypothetical protein
MPWWAPLGGVIGAFAVIAGLLFVGKVGAGAFAGLTITANILMSLVFDHFSLFGVQQHSIGPGRWRCADDRRYLRHFKVLSGAVTLYIYTERAAILIQASRAPADGMAIKGREFGEVVLSNILMRCTTISEETLRGGLKIKGNQYCKETAEELYATLPLSRCARDRRMWSSTRWCS